MDSHELRQAYGDSHTLEWPSKVDAEPHLCDEDKRPEHNPLDSPDVVETAHAQGWGC